MFEHSFYFIINIFMNKHSRNTISDRQLFSWHRSKRCIVDFLLQRTERIFEALVQRTGGCTNLLQGC